MRVFDFLKEKLNSGKFSASDGKSYKDILEIIIIPAAALFMVIAATLFLGGLFHKIQPWFSRIQGLIVLLYGLYCFWYAHRISKILSTSQKNKWINWDFNFSFKAGIISVITAIVAFVFATLKDPGLHSDSIMLFSVMLFIIGFGLYCFGLYWFGFFRALWELRSEDLWYLFSWDNVPGNDNEELLWFLRDDLDIDWAKNVAIRKSDDGKTIRIFKDENSAEIKIDVKKEKATLKISDGRTYELKVKKEKGKLKIYEIPEKFLLTDAGYLGQIVGYCVVGLLYVAIFLPLTFRSATIHGLNFADVLLFAHLTEASADLGILGGARILLDFSNPSHLFAFGVFYGVIGIIHALMIVSIRKEGKLEILTMSNGLAGGYCLTIGVKHLLGTPFTSSLLFSSALSFSYVFLLYYGLRSFADIISRWGIRAKFEYGIGGIQSIGTAWVLSRVFGGQAIVFTGMTFFICTFVATSVFEATIGRLIKPMYPIIPERMESFVPVVLALVREHNQDFRVSVLAITVITGVFPIFAFIVLKLAIMAL